MPVSHRAYGLYGQLLRSTTVSCYGHYGEPDRTKFLLKNKKTRTVNTVSTVMLPVNLRSIRSPDHRNRMGSVIQAITLQSPDLEIAADLSHPPFAHLRQRAQPPQSSTQLRRASSALSAYIMTIFRSAAAAAAAAAAPAATGSRTLMLIRCVLAETNTACQSSISCSRRTMRYAAR